MQVLTIVLLMICNGQNPGSSTSGTFHNKCSKMPPPASMHKCTSEYLHAYDVIYYAIAVRARRMVRIFFLPYLGNRSKSDPCSYELFCLESHILSFPKVLQIPPESLCIYEGTSIILVEVVLSTSCSERICFLFGYLGRITNLIVRSEKLALLRIELDFTANVWILLCSNTKL